MQWIGRCKINKDSLQGFSIFFIDFQSGPHELNDFYLKLVGTLAEYGVLWAWAILVLRNERKCKLNFVSLQIFFQHPKHVNGYWFVLVVIETIHSWHRVNLQWPSGANGLSVLTHWGRVTHICVSELTIIGSDNGLSPGRCQAIIWTNAGIVLIGPWGTNFSEILIEILAFSFKKMHLKMSSGKWRPFCLGLNVLTYYGLVVPMASMC